MGEHLRSRPAFPREWRTGLSRTQGRACGHEGNNQVNLEFKDRPRNECRPESERDHGLGGRRTKNQPKAVEDVASDHDGR